MEHLWELLGMLVTAVGGYWGGWFFTKKKYNAEVKSMEVQNFDASINAYKRMYEDMIDDLKAQNGELRDEVSSLKNELAENRKQLLTLTNFVLASALKRADNIDDASLNPIKDILNV